MAYDNRNLKNLQSDLLKWAKDLDLKSFSKIKKEHPSEFRDLSGGHSRVLKKFWSHVITNVKNADTLEKEKLSRQYENLKSKNEKLSSKLEQKQRELEKDQEEIKKFELKLAAQEGKLHQYESKCSSAQHDIFSSQQKTIIHDTYKKKMLSMCDELKTDINLYNQVKSSVISVDYMLDKLQKHISVIAKHFNNNSDEGNFWEFVLSEKLSLDDSVVAAAFHNLCRQEAANVIRSSKETAPKLLDDAACSNLQEMKTILTANADACRDDAHRIAKLESESNERIDLIQTQLLPQCLQKIQNSYLQAEEYFNQLKSDMEYIGCVAAYNFLSNKVVSFAEESSSPESSYKHLVREIQKYDETSHRNQQKLLQLISTNNALLKNNYICNEFDKSVQHLQKDKFHHCRNAATNLHKDFKKNFQQEHKLFKGLNILTAQRFSHEHNMNNISIMSAKNKEEFVALAQILNISSFCYTSDILKQISFAKRNIMFWESLNIHTIPLFDLSKNVSKTLSHLLKKDHSFNPPSQVFHCKEINSFNASKNDFETTLEEWISNPVGGIIRLGS